MRESHYQGAEALGELTRFVALLERVRFFAHGVCEIRAMRPDSAPSLNLPISSPSNLPRIAQMASGMGKNVYFGVAPRRPGCVGGRDAITRCVFVHADIDDRASAQFPLTPTAVVSSGRGVHLYYGLTDAVSVADADRLSYSLGLRVHADSCWDASRVLRVPGTLNYPGRRKLADGRSVSPVVFLSSDGPLYSPAQMRAAIGFTAPPNAAPTHEPRAPAILTASRLAELLPPTGWPCTGDRSVSDWAVAVNGFVRGGSAAEVAALLLANPTGKALERGDSYVRSTVNNARAAGAAMREVVDGLCVL